MQALMVTDFFGSSSEEANKQDETPQTFFENQQQETQTQIFLLKTKEIKNGNAYRT